MDITIFKVAQITHKFKNIILAWKEHKFKHKLVS